MLKLILQGKVIKGEAVGRTIGFPTANLKLVKTPKIKHGVYAALVTLEGQSYLGLAYFGPRYIFGEKQNSFEVFIFNFKLNIYGQNLRVKLLKFLRRPQRVSGLTDLKILLQQDIKRLDNQVILVDREDNILGIETKINAHVGRAKLHRAVSVQLFNKKGELLIQKRSKYKRLFPLFWANTVCTDVRPYENYQEAATRRLKEEFGLTAKLKPAFKFSYAAKWGKNGEREIDQVFFGEVSGRPRPDKKEIAAWLFADIKQLPRPLAPWFKLMI